MHRGAISAQKGSRVKTLVPIPEDLQNRDVRPCGGPPIPATLWPVISTPIRTDKPWGYELLWASTARYAGKILHVNRGEALSLQHHRKKEETQYVLSGRLRVELGEPGDGPLKTFEMGPGECLHLAPGTRHRLTAIEDTDVLEVSTPELDDVVRHEDRYGRAGTSRP